MAVKIDQVCVYCHMDSTATVNSNNPELGSLPEEFCNYQQYTHSTLQWIVREIQTLTCYLLLSRARVAALFWGTFQDNNHEQSSQVSADIQQVKCKSRSENHSWKIEIPIKNIPQ